MTCAQSVEVNETEFQSQMHQLNETVRAKTAVPTSQVYVR